MIVCVSIFSCSFSVRMQCITKQCLAQFLTGFALYKFSSSLLLLNSWSLDQQLLNWWILVRMSCSWSVSKSAPCCLQRDAALDYMSVSLCLCVSVSVCHHVCVSVSLCVSTFCGFQILYHQLLSLVSWYGFFFCIISPTFRYDKL